LGAYGLGKQRPLGRPFETFNPGWGSILVEPEVAGAWADLPPLVKVELQHAFSPKAYIHFRMGLRRDLAAWHEDGLALNAPFASKEVDLNEPSLGYFNWTEDFLDFTLGRFPLHWSPSPEFGLALSSAVPYHNGAQLVFKFPRLRYRFLVSSLNPWLEGTPAGGTSGEDYPVGSEEWRQRNYPDIGGTGNAHKRVYDARIKTLLAHRVEGWWGPMGMGITETNVVGGKVPDLRDMNPFAVFHNNFGDGYSNNSMSLDALVRLPAGLSLAAEAFMDDLEWGETEGESATPSVMGYLGALRHSFAAHGWFFSQSVHAVYTDPFLYGFQQPLNTLASRHVLTSNFQEDSDPVFVDKHVVDYPIGYLRGGDAMDFWYILEARRGRSLSAELRIGWLAQGEVSETTPFELYYEPHGSAPSGRPEEELRIQGRVGCAWRHGLAFSAGAGFSQVTNVDHEPGRSDLRPGFHAGLSWSLGLPETPRSARTRGF
jgi:hypothetical protein